MKLIRNFVVLGILVSVVAFILLSSYKEFKHNEADTCLVTVDSKNTYTEFSIPGYVIFKIPMSNRVYELELTLENGNHIFESVSEEAYYKYQEGDTIELHKKGSYFVSDDNEISILAK